MCLCGLQRELGRHVYGHVEVLHGGMGAVAKEGRVFIVAVIAAVQHTHVGQERINIKTDASTDTQR